MRTSDLDGSVGGRRVQHAGERTPSGQQDSARPVLCHRGLSLSATGLLAKWFDHDRFVRLIPVVPVSATRGQEQPRRSSSPEDCGYWVLEHALDPRGGVGRTTGTAMLAASAAKRMSYLPEPLPTRAPRALPPVARQGSRGNAWSATSTGPAPRLGRISARSLPVFRNMGPGLSETCPPGPSRDVQF